MLERCRGLRCWVVAICAVLASATTCGDQPAGSGFLALVGGTLIDGSGAEPVPDATIVIRAERILYAGPADAIELPTAAAVLDVHGRTVLPGFINSHVHGALSVPRLEAWAWAGVTTVRDLGCSPAALAPFRAANPPDPLRARLVAAGPLITVSGGYPIVPFGGGWTTTISSEEEARTVAEDILDGGADLLKLALETGTVFGLTIPVMSPQQAAMLVRVAHGRGTLASAHVTSVVDLELALSSGVDEIAHMVVDREIPDSLLQQVVAADIRWVPTLELWQCAGLEAMAVHNLGRFLAAGGTVALGTDYQGYACSWDGGMPMTEIELMTEAGMTAMEIIVAATRNAAGACNLERDLGTVGKGMVADLIVLDQDPLEDLHALEQVRLVIHDGTVIRNELPTWQGPSPRRPTRRVRPGSGGP